MLALEEKLGRGLPAVYAAFLRSNAEQIRGECLMLYAAEDVLERNEAFQVARFAPGWLAVGDDSGGRLVIIRMDDPEAAPFLVDAGALPFADLRQPLAKSWAEWSGSGFSLSE